MGDEAGGHQLIIVMEMYGWIPTLTCRFKQMSGNVFRTKQTQKNKDFSLVPTRNEQTG